MPCKDLLVRAIPLILVATSGGCQSRQRVDDASPSVAQGTPAAPSVASPSVVAADATSDGEPRTAPFDSAMHCSALTLIAQAAVLGDQGGQALPTPSGFTSCAWGPTIKTEPGQPMGAGLNHERWYRCRSASLAALESDFYEALAKAWRACLRKPAWRPAATVRYANGVTSGFKDNPDAYISTRFVRDTFLFSEGYCALRKNDDVAELTCGARYNN
jgi:hypothetical protein